MLSRASGRLSGLDLADGVRGDLFGRGAPQDAVVWGDIEHAGRVVRGLLVAASRLQGRGFSSGTDSAVSQVPRSGQEPIQAQFSGHVTRIKSAISHLLPFASGVSISAETGSAWSGFLPRKGSGHS